MIDTLSFWGRMTYRPPDVKQSCTCDSMYSRNQPDKWYCLNSSIDPREPNPNEPLLKQCTVHVDSSKFFKLCRCWELKNTAANVSCRTQSLEKSSPKYKNVQIFVEKRIEHLRRVYTVGLPDPKLFQKSVLKSKSNKHDVSSWNASFRNCFSVSALSEYLSTACLLNAISFARSAFRSAAVLAPSACGLHVWGRRHCLPDYAKQTSRFRSILRSW